MTVAVYQVVVDMYIAMRSCGCDDQEEWLLGYTPKTVFEEAIGLLGDYICTVAALVAYGKIIVALKRCIEVLIGVGIQEEVRAGPASSIRRVVVVNCLRIEQLSNVVSVVASVLEPDGKVGGIEALAGELGIASYRP